MPEVKQESTNTSPEMTEVVGETTQAHNSDSSRTHWDAKMELALFHAVMKNRPVGIHKHFRMINIHRDFNEKSHIKRTIPEIWARLSHYYALDALDEMEYDVDDDDTEATQFTEFSLPLEEFEHLLSEHRKATSAGSATLGLKQSKRRDSSPTPSGTSSTRSTPEGEDVGQKKRRPPARPAKKSETVEKTPAKRASRTKPGNEALSASTSKRSVAGTRAAAKKAGK